MTFSTIVLPTGTKWLSRIENFYLVLISHVSIYRTKMRMVLMCWTNAFFPVVYVSAPILCFANKKDTIIISKKISVQG